MVLVAERIPKDLSIKDKSYNVLLCYHYENQINSWGRYIFSIHYNVKDNS